MKRILASAIFIASTFTAFSQSLNYNDLGILFSKDDNYGTSRFNAMSGAFGALGADISSVGINPAGGAMARKSKASVTLGVNSLDATTNYYGTTTNTQDEFLNLSQAGGIFVFDTHYSNSNWNRFAFTFNYRLKSDFEGSFIARGNGDYLNFTENPNENNNSPYTNGISQEFSRSTNGQSSEFNLGFSAVHDNKLYVGASLNFHHFDFREIGRLNEISEDTNGNKLNAVNTHDSYFESTGFSLGLGFIYKLDQNVRFGLAYQTPTWYQEVLEDTNVFLQDEANMGFPGLVDIRTTDPDGSNPIDYQTPDRLNAYVYSFRSPSRLTASGAYVFGKKGLISLDYTYKNYKGTKFTDGNFANVNQSFSEDYRNTHALNVGAEWRFDEKLSARGGYHYEKNPNLLLGGNTNKDNVKGFSAGLGYKFGNATVDLSYYQTENTDFYKLYQLNDLNVENNNSRITATLTFNL